jgi:hypothetical protein
MQVVQYVFKYKHRQDFRVVNAVQEFVFYVLANQKKQFLPIVQNVDKKVKLLINVKCVGNMTTSKKKIPPKKNFANFFFPSHFTQESLEKKTWKEKY